MLLALCLFPAFSGASELEELLNQLDKALDNSSVYVGRRQHRIDSLYSRLSSASDLHVRYDLQNKLAEEYRKYMCDSAVRYYVANIRLAEKMPGGEVRADHDRLSLSYLLSSAGIYQASLEVLKTVNSAKLPDSLRIAYYECYDHAYGEMAYNNIGNQIVYDYQRISKLYKDSLLAQLPKNSELWLSMEETRLRDGKNYRAALQVNNLRLKKAVGNISLYALVQFHRSLIYEHTGEREKQMEALARSALADIHLGIKDHASLWNLAWLLYKEGDIRRAYRYMHFSWEDTKFFNAPLRSWQSANILSIIEKQYQADMQRSNHKLKVMIAVASVLSLLLLAALVFIYRYMKRLRFANKRMELAHRNMQSMNDRLKSLNEELKNANAALSKSNEIKEVYITHFVRLCSSYIDKMDRFRIMVNKRLSSGHAGDLLKLTRSHHMLDDDVEELYQNFDAAFLHIFPDFVTKFNDLLQESEQIVPKSGELLTPELRIFALIRLGIDESSQIAEFLRYSVNTIYNYRAKVKNKAKVERTDFEILVKNIS